MTDLPAELTRSQFAAHIGRRPSYVTRLGKDGRLVLTDDGKRVRVGPTLDLIAASRDPAKAGVVERLRRERAAKGAEQPPEAPEAELPADVPSYVTSRAKKEHFAALREQREHERECGLLMERDPVLAVIADAVVVLRQQLEALPVVLGPVLAAEREEARCVAMLREHVESALADASARFKNLANEARDA